ncbi:MAG: C-GCAxxG-C-C family protein [Syntrophomonadaceae bacterium]|jgi:C_GCAxxG_C_C family probable redox protein
MNKEEIINQARENARQNFREGLNCAESVLQAVVDTGIIEDFPPEIVAVSTGFGGGIGQYGTLCGALAGATIAVGCVHGRKNPKVGTFEERVNQLQGNPGLYRLFNNLPNDFAERFGACQCQELTSDFKDNFLSKERKKMCHQYVIEAAGMAVDYIIRGKEEGYTQKMRKNMHGKE